MIDDKAAIVTRLQQTLPAWRYENGAIVRRYRTSGWPATLLVVNAVGHLAQAADHHPDLIVGYAAVDVRLSTHSTGAVTDKDFALAAKIDELVLWHPSTDSALKGAPANTYIRHDD